MNSVLYKFVFGFYVFDYRRGRYNVVVPYAKIYACPSAFFFFFSKVSFYHTTTESAPLHKFLRFSLTITLVNTGLLVAFPYPELGKTSSVLMRIQHYLSQFHFTAANIGVVKHLIA